MAVLIFAGVLFIAYLYSEGLRISHLPQIARELVSLVSRLRGVDPVGLFMLSLPVIYLLLTAFHYHMHKEYIGFQIVNGVKTPIYQWVDNNDEECLSGCNLP